MPVPIVHIGYPGSATAWLQRQFFPGLGDRVACFGLDRFREELVSPSPLDFDPHCCKRHVSGLLAAHPGRVCVFSAARLSGNPHAGGWDGAEMARRIRASFDQVRILIIVREQRAMLVSGYKQHVGAGGTCSLEEYLASQGDGRGPFVRLDDFRYHRLVEYYVRLFGDRRVLVLPCELLPRDPAAFARRVLDYIGLEAPDHPEQGGPDAWRNSPTDLHTRIRRRVNLLGADDSSYLARRTVPWLAARLCRLVDRLGAASLGRRPAARFHERAASVVGDRYAASNRRLQHHLPCDLRALGYRVAPPQ